MCVAAVIFNAVPLEHLECMEHDNPHGAGVAWCKNGEIRFLKGLTAREIYDMQTEGVMTYPYLMHYRWATHGGRVSELTHPFVLGPRALMGELSGTCQSLMMHNGTWGSYDRVASKYVNQGNYEMPEELLAIQSDTAIAAWLALDNPDVLDGVAWATVVAEMVNGEMEITTRGTWSDKDGNWYSNLNWVPYDYTPGMYSSDQDKEWWQSWNKWYNAGGTRGTKSESPQPQPAYAIRNEEDIYLTWEEFCSKYGTPSKGSEGYDEPSDKKSSIEVVPTRPTSYRGSVTWDEYIRAKYGDEVARELYKCFPETAGEDCGEGCAETSEDEEWFQRESFCDPDIVSEDFETVNSILARQMCRGG